MGTLSIKESRCACRMGTLNQVGKLGTTEFEFVVEEFYFVLQPVVYLELHT
jgi:hypothetical protein